MKKFISFLLCVLVLNLCIPVFALQDIVVYNDIKTEELVLPKKLAKKTPINAVRVSETYYDIVKYNTLQVKFAQNFNSKNAKAGDIIEFLLDEDLVTKSGTVVLPKATKIVTEIINVEKPRAFNKCGKVYLDFKYVDLPDGTQIPFEAKVFSKKDYLARGKVNALGKGLGSTLGGMGVGIAAGCGIGVAASAVIIGGFAIGLPVGFAIGAGYGLIAPGLYYKAKAGDKIDIQLTQSLIINK